MQSYSEYQQLSIVPELKKHSISDPYLTRVWITTLSTCILHSQLSGSLEEKAAVFPRYWAILLQSMSNAVGVMYLHAVNCALKYRGPVIPDAPTFALDLLENFIIPNLSWPNENTHVVEQFIACVALGKKRATNLTLADVESRHGDEWLTWANVENAVQKPAAVLSMLIGEFDEQVSDSLHHCRCEIAVVEHAKDEECPEPATFLTLKDLDPDRDPKTADVLYRLGRRVVPILKKAAAARDKSDESELSLLRSEFIGLHGDPQVFDDAIKEMHERYLRPNDVLAGIFHRNYLPRHELATIERFMRKVSNRPRSTDET